jgi:hypothetical protein
VSELAPDGTLTAMASPPRLPHTRGWTHKKEKSLTNQPRVWGPDQPPTPARTTLSLCVCGRKESRSVWQLVGEPLAEGTMNRFSFY